MKRRAAVEVFSVWLLTSGVCDAGIESFANPCVAENCASDAASIEALPAAKESPRLTDAPVIRDDTDIDQDTELERKATQRAPIMRSADPTEDVVSFRVEGYRGKEYVHGELVLGQQAVLEGYVYRTDGTRVYVYGEQSQTGRIEAYDRQGELFLLTALE